MAKDPAYPMYAQDFDMDTADWGIDEIGVYIRLLNYEWINGYIPNNLNRISKIVRISPRKLQKLWEIISKKFSPNGTHTLQNKRMEEEREKRNKYIESQRESGKRGAKKRWKRHSKPNGDPIGKPNGEKIAFQSSSSSSSSISSSTKKKKVSNETLCPHQKIIALYHQCLPELPEVREWNDPYQSYLKTRWKEKQERQTLEWWKDFFLNNIKTSDFLMGRKKDFQANLGWIVCKNNFTKILNGQYRNYGPKTGSTQTDNNIRAAQAFLDRED